MSEFIYNNREWESTGRQAIRSNKRDTSKDDVLIEIRPKGSDDSDGGNLWIRHEELYHVITVEN